MAELTVLAHIYLVFADIPQILESRRVDGLFQCGVLDIAVAFAHCRAVFDVSLRIDADFAVEAGVVTLGFGEKGEVIDKSQCTNLGKIYCIKDINSFLHSIESCK